jgi:hypothetical protein
VHLQGVPLCQCLFSTMPMPVIQSVKAKERWYLIGSHSGPQVLDKRICAVGAAGIESGWLVIVRGCWAALWMLHLMHG